MEPVEGRIAFGRFSVDLETRELSSGQHRVSLQEKPYLLLLALLERPGRVVRRQRLYDALWPAEMHVDREAGLNTAVRKLRSALRDLGDDGEPLETVPRIGYRLLVGRPARSLTAVPDAPRPAGDERPRWALLVAVALLAAVTLGVLAWTSSSRTTSGRSPSAPPVVNGPEPMPPGDEQRGRYLEARSLIAQANGDLSRAHELLRSLTAEVPDFAPAHAYLGEASARLAIRTHAEDDVEQARAAARRALEIDPASAVAHRVLAMMALTFDWDLATAAARLERALEIDAGDPDTQMASAAYHSALGRHDEAIAAARRAVDLEPDSMLVRGDAGHFLLRAGRFAEAARECELVLRVDHENRYARDCLITAYDGSGRVEAARPHVEHLLEVDGAPEREIERAATHPDPRGVYLEWSLARLLERPERASVRIATHYLSLGDEEGALNWLEVAARERSPLLIFVPQNASFAATLSQPLYRDVLREAGLDLFTAPLPRGARAGG